jgi:hypothetical protein
MSILKNANFNGNINILSNNSAYNVYNSTYKFNSAINVNTNATLNFNEIHGINKYIFPGYGDIAECWENVNNSVGILNETEIEDSWSVAESLNNSWRRGFLSKARFRRVDNLTIEFDAKWADYSSLKTAISFNIIDGNLSDPSFDTSTQKHGIYFYSTDNTVRIHENGSLVNNISLNVSSWYKFKIILYNKGCSYHYVDLYNNKHTMIHTSTKNTFEYIRLLISTYRGKLHLKNLKVYIDREPLTFYNLTRGVICGGSTEANKMQFIDIRTPGNSIFAGYLTYATRELFNLENGYNNRGMVGGGQNGLTVLSVINYFAINVNLNASATTSLSYARRCPCFFNNGNGNTGAIYNGSSSTGASYVYNIETFNISTSTSLSSSNSAFAQFYAAASCDNSNNNRGITINGYAGSALNALYYLTINTGSDLTNMAGYDIVSRYSSAGTSNSISNRGVIAGGNTYTNVISYIDISSTAGAVDFGDLNTVRNSLSSCSDGIYNRGLFIAGTTTGAIPLKTMEYITINTTGNGNSFGEIINNSYAPTSLSNSI